jgi:hypothetical protein
MNVPITLFSKKDFQFQKIKNKHYRLTFQMTNHYIRLENIINFQLIQLIYDLNADIYEKINFQIINEEEATVNLLMKHLFEDIGLPQKYSYFHIKREKKEKEIDFYLETIHGERPKDTPDDAELIHVEQGRIHCEIITPHEIWFTLNLHVKDDIYIPNIVEKMMGLITFKIFNRVKQFIENVRL